MAQITLQLFSDRKLLLHFSRGFRKKLCGQFFRSLHLKHSSMSTKSYQTAITALNTLQSNAQTLEKARREKTRPGDKNIPWMERLLDVLGIELLQLDALNVIHISGTKGKGSTCAFTESLLRNLGYRTGFYSSPHLVAVRERIRLNGKPISEELFARYFWEVYERITDVCQPEEVPPYFKFLTVMCYYVFVKEKVDVAVMEVGIGGAYDCTNVIRNPIVCGVTSLGYDHMPILGNTLSEIAWHKAGIFKPGCPAVTVSQPEEAMRVLGQRANEIGTCLSLAPDFAQYSSKTGLVKLGLDGAVQGRNASLALQLVKQWLARKTAEVDRKIKAFGLEKDRNRSFVQCEKDVKGSESSKVNGTVEPEVEAVERDGPGVTKTHHVENSENAAADLVELPAFPLTTIQISALETCVWPGRFQRVLHEGIQFYLDGAHTKDSVRYCAEWFRNVRSASSSKRILIFNSTADRNPEDLLRSLTECEFDFALFCPNILGDKVDSRSDLANLMVNRDQQLARCALQESVWTKLMLDKDDGGKTTTRVFSSVRESLHWIDSSREEDKNFPLEVLVTGSLHLVGAVLSVVDPSLKNTL